MSCIRTVPSKRSEVMLLRSTENDMVALGVLSSWRLRWIAEGCFYIRRMIPMAGWVLRTYVG